MHDPQPPEDIDAWMESAPRARVRYAATDPSTALPALVRLAARFPADVLANPAFELAIVTDPSFLRAMPQKSLMRLVDRPEFPPELLVVLARWHTQGEVELPRVARRIAMHPNAPQEALDVLVTDPIAELNVNHRSAFAAPWLDALRAMASRSWRDATHFFPTEGDARVLSALARNGSIDGFDPFINTVIGMNGRGAMLRYVRAQRQMAPEFVESALRRPAAITAHERGLRLRQLRTSPPSSSHHLRAERSEFCGSLERGDDPVALAIAGRQADRMRATLALGDVLPHEMVRRLMTDPQWRVRAAVAMRPQLSIDDSWVMTRDPEPRVRSILARHTRHPEIVAALARDLDLRVQHACLEQPMLDAAIEAELTSADRIHQSLMDGWRRGCMVNGDGTRLSMSEQCHGWTVQETALLALRNYYNSLPRIAFVAGPRCPVEVLLRHATSASPWERIAVARNARTPREVVERLAHRDGLWVVRAAAMERLAGPEPAVPAMEPVPAVACSEPDMPHDLQTKVARLRSGLVSSTPEGVTDAIDAGLADPDVRPILLAGMLVGRTRVRLTAFSEIGRRVPYAFRRLAEDRVAVGLGLSRPMDAVERR